MSVVLCVCVCVLQQKNEPNALVTVKGERVGKETRSKAKKRGGKNAA